MLVAVAVAVPVVVAVGCGVLEGVKVGTPTRGGSAITRGIRNCSTDLKEHLTVKAGEYLYIPAGMPHSYTAEGDEPFEFLCVVPNAPDTIELVEDESAG